MLDTLVSRLENKLGITLPHGVDHSTRRMLLTIDPVAFTHRPLFFYATVKGLDLSGRIALWKAGFKRFHSSRGCITYSKVCPDSTDIPIVFFHGIGIGVSPYVKFILELVKRFPNRTIVLFEKTSVSMKLDRTIILPTDYANKLKNELNRLQITSNSRSWSFLGYDLH